jgi:hypothetical protein
MSIIDDATQVDSRAEPTDTDPAEGPELIIKEARRRKRRRRLLTGSALVIAAAAVVLIVAAAGGAGNSPSDPPTPGGSGPPPSPTPMSQPPVQGYTPSQASSAVASCSSVGATHTSSGGPTEVLADTASDSDGTSLVIASATGWTMCVESADGAYATSLPFQVFGATNGWGASPPTNTPASWLFSPAEVIWSGGGYMSKTDMTWLQQVIGRASSKVAEVSVTMPDGTTVTAPVQNGFFLARQSFSSTPATMTYTGGPIPYIAYDRSGAVLYDNTTASHPACVTTPSGAPISPPSPGAKCDVGTSWGVTYLGP